MNASAVYAMVHGGQCRISAIQQFAAFAAYRETRRETRAFWRALLDQLAQRTLALTPSFESVSENHEHETTEPVMAAHREEAPGPQATYYY